MSQKNIFSNARLLAFQLVYNLGQEGSRIELSDESFKNLKETIEKHDDEGENIIFSNDMIELSKMIIKKMNENKEHVQSIANHSLHKKNLEQLSKTEYALIMLGTSELIHAPDLNAKKLINCYINLAKKYGSKDSYSLINGVLDSVQKSL